MDKCKDHHQLRVKLAKAAMRVGAPNLSWGQQDRATKDHWLAIVDAVISGLDGLTWEVVR